MKFLLTNDDGISAPGLAALADAIAPLGPSLVVAPEEHQSGCSHQVNHSRALWPKEVSPGRFSIDGTPADCTRIGLLYLAPETTWVLSGVNEGGNLGVDVYMSGTVAAVREGTLFGRPGIAFSQYRRTRNIDWSRHPELVRYVVKRLLERPLKPGAFWNVNFPDPLPTEAEPELVFCPLDATSHLPVAYELRVDRYHYRGIYHDRPRIAGGDVDVCFSGRIAISQILPAASE